MNTLFYWLKIIKKINWECVLHDEKKKQKERERMEYEVMDKNGGGIDFIYREMTKFIQQDFFFLGIFLNLDISQSMNFKLGE